MVHDQEKEGEEVGLLLFNRSDKLNRQMRGFNQAHSHPKARGEKRKENSKGIKNGCN
jgi:hypothetical protein